MEVGGEGEICIDIFVTVVNVWLVRGRWIYLVNTIKKMFMRKLNILLLDWMLSKSKISEALSLVLSAKLFNVGNLIKEQLNENDDLGNEIKKVLESGEKLTTEIIGKVILRKLKGNIDNVLLLGYPRSVEELIELKKILTIEDFKLVNIWYFKQREPNEFMNRHFQSLTHKPWFDKFGAEIIKTWKINFKRRREEVAEIQNSIDESKWIEIETDYVDEVSTEYIIQLIKDRYYHQVGQNQVPILPYFNGNFYK